MKITVVNMANTTSEGYILSTIKQGINSELFLKEELSVTFLLLNIWSIWFIGKHTCYCRHCLGLVEEISVHDNIIGASSG